MTGAVLGSLNSEQVPPLISPFPQRKMLSPIFEWSNLTVDLCDVVGCRSSLERLVRPFFSWVFFVWRPLKSAKSPSRVLSASASLIDAGLTLRDSLDRNMCSMRKFQAWVQIDGSFSPFTLSLSVICKVPHPFGHTPNSSFRASATRIEDLRRVFASSRHYPLANDGGGGGGQKVRACGVDGISKHLQWTLDEGFIGLNGLAAPP